MTNKNWQTDFAKCWVKYWPPPARPTLGRLAFIKKQIEKKLEEVGKDNFKLLILGSTSEFRDMMIDLGIKPTVVDFLENNYHILSGAMKYKDEYEQNEQFICTDWRTMDLGEKFDFILGDAIFNIVPKADNTKVLSNICKHLKSNGIFIDTIWQFSEEHQNFDIRKAIKEHKKDIEDYSFFEVFNALIYKSVLNEKTNTVELKDCARLVENLYEESYLTGEQIKEFRLLEKDKMDFEFFFPKKETALERLKEFFEIKEEFIDTDYPFYPECFPSYVLKNK